jgi:hypothetical protein
LTEPFRTLVVCLVGAWAGALAVAVLGTPLLVRRRGRDAAWPALRILLALVDVLGTWAAALAAGALFAGRVGFSAAWAGAMGLVALMATASLYDRAVLLPSLDAAHRRLDAGAAWEDDWRFLWRMAAWGRAATLVLAGGAAACTLLA